MVRTESQGRVASILVASPPISALSPAVTTHFWPMTTVGNHSARSPCAPSEVDGRTRDSTAVRRTLESVYMAPELCDDVQPEEVQDLK
jgi:hypothetical protein